MCSVHVPRDSLEILRDFEISEILFKGWHGQCHMTPKFMDIKCQ